VGELAADGQALAVAQTPVRGEVYQPLDVHCHFAAQVTLHLMLGVDRLADLEHFCVGQVLDPAGPARCRAWRCRLGRSRGGFRGGVPKPGALNPPG